MSCERSPPSKSPPTTESLIVLPRKGPADITEEVRKATNAVCIDASEWDGSRDARAKRDSREPYAVIYPRLRVALTNIPRERLKPAFGHERVCGTSCSICQSRLWTCNRCWTRRRLPACSTKPTRPGRGKSFKAPDVRMVSE